MEMMTTKCHKSTTLHGYVHCLFLHPEAHFHQDNPLQQWRENEREVFLDELIRLEGRGVRTDDQCELCHKEGVYRCLDCIAVQFLCPRCVNSTHSFNPFHVIEVSP
jgi:hypothetical protein